MNKSLNKGTYGQIYKQVDRKINIHRDKQKDYVKRKCVGEICSHNDRTLGKISRVFP